ncbi:DUF3383 domain-containing protein [Rhizobium sp. No.120]
MASGLNVSDVVNVTINLAPKAAAQRNFGAELILGSSDVIDTAERIREYSDLDGIAEDFGTTAAEYIAADFFFSQEPQPSICYVGRWAQTATSGRLNGGVLSASEQQISNFTSITNGSMKIDIDGATKTLSALNFSAVTNLNGVASIIDTALAGASVVWDSVSQRFIVESSTTGTTSTVGYASATGSGTDISAMLNLVTGVASPPVAGVAAETLLSAVQTLADISNAWYGLTVATSTPAATSDYLAVAAFIEGASQSHIFGITITNPSVLDVAVTNDLASQLKALGYKRTFTQFSSSSPYAVTSMAARAFTVNFEANNSTITLKFKQEPGVAAETLTESQAATLKAKNCNVFVNYNNDTAIIQEGVMANGYFFDEVHGTDWLQNAIQTDLYNLLYQSPTKIPQTDDGTHLLVTTIEATMARAVNNGLVAPGVWNAPGFGQLKQGQMLTSGYYVYAPLVASQSQSDREARKSVPIQVAAKLAGAVHSVNVLINVNR